MIYDYVQTKPSMEEVIQHGWAKDAAAKVHKYLERHRNAAGKWVYKYFIKPKKDKATNKNKLQYNAVVSAYRKSQNRSAARRKFLDSRHQTMVNKSQYNKVVAGLKASSNRADQRRKKYLDDRESKRRAQNKANYYTNSKRRNAIDTYKKAVSTLIDGTKKRNWTSSYKKNKSDSNAPTSSYNPWKKKKK